MPADPTLAQSAASRRNGGLGHGPASDEGKARSALNAHRHGLGAQGFVLRPEEQERFSALHEAFRRRWPPADAIMDGLITDLAQHALLRRRLAELEMTVMTAHLGRAAMTAEELAGCPDPRLPSLATLARYRTRLEQAERAVRDQIEALRGQDDQATKAAAAPARTTPRTNEPEPRPHSQPLPGTGEAEPAASPPLNRHERRRLEALGRRQGRLAA